MVEGRGDIKGRYQARAEELAVRKAQQEYCTLSNTDRLLIYDQAIKEVNEEIIMTGIKLMRRRK